jgi:hypothetical protein
MTLSTELLLRFTRLTEPIDKGVGYLNIIIKRPYSILEKEMRNVFRGEENVHVVVDRRSTERRQSTKPVSNERRGTNRRRLKEVLVEASISV